ncbi:MAG: PspA/IM30 family protein [Desulfovibrionaceae bacterium]|jgi:phage shock protein A|nr:PspA/IM30 family protein [Desulfovibrionaceae bacterium]
MSFLTRLANLFRGFLSLFVSGLEKSSPQVVYENAINAMIKKFEIARNAVASIIANRQVAEQRLKKAQTEKEQVDRDLDAAVNVGDEELGTVLIQKQEQLAGIITSATADLARLSSQADESKAMLTQFKSEIERLKAERDEQLARQATAKAQIQIQDQLSGLSVDAEIRALDNVREGINQTVAKAALNSEMAGADVDERLKKLRQTAGTTNASAKFKALQAARAASENKTL